MIKVKEIIQTCPACPSQWEGVTDDGRPIYIRYRWGSLSVSIGEKGGDVTSAVRGEVILGKELGEGLDGSLEYSKLREVVKNVIELPTDSPTKWKEYNNE